MGSTKSLRDSQRQSSGESRLQLTGHLRSVPLLCPRWLWPHRPPSLAQPPLAGSSYEMQVAIDIELQVNNGHFFNISMSQAIFENTYTKKLFAVDLKLTCNWEACGFVC